MKFPDIWVSGAFRAYEVSGNPSFGEGLGIRIPQYCCWQYMLRSARAGFVIMSTVDDAKWIVEHVNGPGAEP